MGSKPVSWTLLASRQLLTPSEHSLIACLFVVKLPVPLSHRPVSRAAFCDNFPASRISTCALWTCPRAATIGSCRRRDRGTSTNPRHLHRSNATNCSHAPPLFFGFIHTHHGPLNAPLQIGSRHTSYSVPRPHRRISTDESIILHSGSAARQGESGKKDKGNHSAIRLARYRVPTE